MAGDTFTEFLNLTKPEIGGSRDSWGQKINGVFDAIDTWAKATDTLAKNALSKEVTTAQTVKGPTTFAEPATFSKSLSIPKAQQFRLGTAYFQELQEETTVDLKLGTGNQFRIVNKDYTAPVLTVTPTVFAYNSQTIWYAGNFTPGNYFDKSTTTGQQVAGTPSFNSTAIDIVRNGVLRRRIQVDGDGYTRFSNGDNGAQHFAFGVGGDIWTSQLGDLNNRIENRAAFFANDRLATARAEYAGHAKWAGGTFTGGVNFNSGIGMSGDTPTISMFNTSGAVQKITLPSTGHVTIRDGADADNHRFQHLGKIWTREFGDLNDRIEARALAWANDRLNIARTEYANHAKTNVYNEFTADQRIGKAGAELQLLWGGVARWGIKVNEDAYLYFRRPDDNVTLMAMSYQDGAIFSRQFNGFLNDRIEQRAIAWADDRLNIARTEYAGKLNRNSDTMGGLLTIITSGTQLLLNANNGNAVWSLLSNGPDGRFYIQDFYQGAFRNNPFSVGRGGDVTTLQFGDLNTRIENRAAAWATDQANDARARADRITGRLAYAGDLDNNWNLDQNYAEPYGGGVLTSRYSITTPYGKVWGGGRWRYMQMKGTNDAWYTISYV